MVNTWVSKSIKLANESNYLDRLVTVYPIVPGSAREISNRIVREIRTAYDKKDHIALLKLLFRLKKFPIKDSYVPFLRKKRDEGLKLNPKTAKRIGERLFSMTFAELLEGIREPKEVNRQIGPMFRNWLPSLGYHFLPSVSFTTYDGIAFLDSSEQGLMDFANRTLDANVTKGLDFVAKVVDLYVIGEAKFLTDSGGHQNAQFNDAMNLVEGEEGEAIRVAILDGVVWIRGRTKMFKRVSSEERNILSALLLRDFLESLRNPEALARGAEKGKGSVTLETKKPIQRRLDSQL